MPDNYRTRQIIIISIVVLIVLIFAYALYRFLSSRGARIVPNQSPQAPVSGGVGSFESALQTPIIPQATPLPSPTTGLEDKIKEQTLMQLTDFPIIGPAFTKTQDNVLFYKKDGGSVYKVDFSGTQEKISNITIVGLADAIWSPMRDRASVFYVDSEILKSFLHLSTSSVTSLPRDIKSFSWSPDGKQFAYLIQNVDHLELIISDASSKTNKHPFSTPILDAQITWISPDTIAFQTAPSGKASGFVFLYSLKNGTFRKFLGPLSGLTTRWSPDGAHVLVGSTHNQGHQPSLSLYDLAGNQNQQFDFTTLPDKCAWISAKEFDCAIPSSFPSNAVLPDDYLRGEFATQDHILSFNLDTTDSAIVFSGGAFTMSDLSVTNKKDYLIFVNRTDGTLWRLKLGQ